MNALTILTDDHDKMRKLLTELETTTERGLKTRAELFSTIKGELTVHEIIEEEIFYPALKSHPKAKDIVLEGYQEHHVVDLVVSELEDLDVSDETWGAKAKVMQENVEHHMEEEEGDMFKTARSVFDAGELNALGDQMAERRRSAAAELGIPSKSPAVVDSNGPRWGCVSELGVDMAPRIEFVTRRFHLRPGSRTMTLPVSVREARRRPARSPARRRRGALDDP